MYIAFVDEAGYAKGDWASGDLNEQPIFVHAAVIVKCEDLNKLYTSIKTQINKLLEPEHGSRFKDWVEGLGIGNEIKARNVDRGSELGAFKHVREELVSTFLYPEDSLFTSIVVAVHKKEHLEERGDKAFELYAWALRLLSERVHYYVNRRSSKTLLVLDSTPEEGNYLQELESLIKIGSIIYPKNKPFDFIRVKLDSISDIYFGNSKYSLGLQIADFYARFAYSALKRGDPTYPGWS